MSTDRTDRNDLFANKVPPQNLDAERGVLGSILLVNDTIDEVSDKLQSESFYSEAHRRIYAAIIRLHDRGVRGIDAVTVAEELERRQELTEVGGVEYIVKVLESVPHAAHAKYYAGIVREKWVQRNLIFACHEILTGCYDGSQDTDDVLQLAEQRVFNILQDQDTTQKVAIGDILIDTFDRINERLQKEGSISGLTTGFSAMDARTNGMQASELIILAARPSMGKTAFVCNVAESAAMVGGRGVLIFSLEQSKLELAERFLCIRSGINGHRLRAGELDEDEQHKLMQASSELSDLPLFLDDFPGRSMSQISAVSRRLQRKHDVGLIIIDYLQLIEPDEKSISREQQIAQITRRLKFLAKELSVPVIALAQLNRGVELREDKRPRLADLRESGAIEQDADVVMFLHRPDAYDPEDRPEEADVIIAKNRSGPTGAVTLRWVKQSMRFEDMEAIQEPPAGFFADRASREGAGF